MTTLASRAISVAAKFFVWVTWLSCMSATVSSFVGLTKSTKCHSQVTNPSLDFACDQMCSVTSSLDWTT